MQWGQAKHKKMFMLKLMIKNRVINIIKKYYINI